VFFIFIFVLCWSTVSAQEKSSVLDRSGSSPVRKSAQAKKQTPPADTVDAGEEAASGTNLERDDEADQIRKRDEWFYKQRSSAGGRIPAGARFRAFQHMQRMMETEGKLMRRPDGTYAAATAQTASTPVWTSIGPTPTTGGVFSPVTGRVTTIAVDPSDSSGNTVLIGGAQGGIWRSTDAGTTWTAVGDQNSSLAMGSIAFAPSQPATVYAGTGEQASIGFDIYYGAGVLKSSDHGQTWTPTCTVAGPSCPFIGPYLDTLRPGFGFFNFGGARISYIAVNPQNPNLVLAAAQLGIEGPTEGIYCSSDGGAHWSNIFPDEMATFVGFASPTVAFAAFGMPFGSSPGAPHGNGIYKSTNANSCSASFSPLSGGLPAQPSIGRIDLGISPNYASDSMVYASIADASTASQTNLGVFLTANGGTSWTQTSAPDICQHQCWYDNVIKVDPLRGGTAYFGGAAVRDSSGNPTWVVRTTNSGASWSSVIPPLPALGQPANPGLPHVDSHAMALFKLPSGKVRLYLGNDGGIWRTDDAEASTIQWTNLNGSTLTLTQFYPTISIHTSTPSTSFGGTQDNSSQQLATPPSWTTNTGTFQTSSGPLQLSVCGDGTSTAIDPHIPSTVYISCQFTSVHASYQTGAPGSFFPAVNGIDPQDPAGFVPPLVADPNLPNVVYFAASAVYESVDAANTWTAISGNIGSPSNGIVINTLAVGAADSSVIYAGFNNGVVEVENNANSGNFTNFSPVLGQANLPIRSVTAIAVDAADPSGKTAYVAYSGFSYVGPDALNPAITINDPQGHIFKTTDEGNTWVDVSCSVSPCTKPAPTDLPNIPVNDVVIDPDLPGTIYAATDLGVYVGTCTATACTWNTVGTGLPHVAVLSLRLHEASRTLRAATHGRGAWDINLNNFSFSGPHISSLTPTSASANSSQLTLTVNGSGLTGGAIQFGGTALSPTGIASDTSLSGVVPTALLTAGSVKITVKVSPTSVSNFLPFNVLALTPTLTSINPANTPVQTTTSKSVSVTLTGTDFATGAKVLFNGAYNGITVGQPTSSCSLPTCLTATLPAALLGPDGSTNDVSVLNTPPGGGKSQAIPFQVVAPPPPNDSFAKATNITTLSFNDLQDSSGATTETTDPVPPCVLQHTPGQGNTGGHSNGVYNTIWYKFTPIFSANLNVDTLNSSYDSVLSIWTGSAGSLVNVACNDDVVPGALVQSQLLSVPLTAGTTYYIMVSSFGPPDPNPIALGGRTQLAFTYNNGFTPTPTISSILPNSAKSGDPSFTLTVTGTGFLNGAVVFLNSTPETTTFVNSTQLTATIPTSDIPLPATVPVNVQNAQPACCFSNSLNFTINLGVYPVPGLSGIIPSSAVAGGVGFTLTALGNNFAPGAVLEFNGIAMQTTVSNTQIISSSISASAIANAGTAQVTIFNPTPGGGMSMPQPFTLTQPTVVPTISSISPAAGASGTSFTLTITGTGFQQGTNVFFNNLYYGGTFTSSTQFSAAFNLTGISPGTYPLYVVDPVPAGTSAPFNFVVTGPPDFTITSSGTTTQTVPAGQAATFTNAITIAPQNGFSAQVNLSCSLPVTATATTCTVTPNMFASGSGTATVKVTTMARGLVPPSWPSLRFISRPQFLPVVMLTILLSTLLLRLARTRRQRFAGALPLAGLVLLLTLQMIGCGGGGGSSFTPPPPPPPTGTPANTYTITVTATSGTLMPHTTTLTLVVQ
jgi:hypothetical protein